MVTGTDEFSLFMKGDPYFASAIKDKTIFTDPVKHQEYAFANKYGGKLYGLFNAEESAEIMKSATEMHPFIPCPLPTAIIRN